MSQVVIIARNIRRRHQSKGQLAMAAAMILPEEKKTWAGVAIKTL